MVSHPDGSLVAWCAGDQVHISPKNLYIKIFKNNFRLPILKLKSMPQIQHFKGVSDLKARRIIVETLQEVVKIRIFVFLPKQNCPTDRKTSVCC